MNVFCRTLTTALAVSLIVFAIGCGDDDVDTGDGDVRQNNQEPAQNDEDCPDGQVYNPVAEECVDEGGEDDPNQTDPNQTDPNQTDPNQTDPNQTDPNQTDPNQTDPPPPGECGPGEIQGQTCGPNEGMLINADVTISGVDCDGEPFEMETTSNENGFFHIDGVPAGDHTLVTESGSFTGTQTVTVTNGQTTDLMAEGKKACLAGDSVDIAVIQGTYDDVGTLLDSLEIEYDVVGSDMGGGIGFIFGDDDAGEFLSDPQEMAQYDILFIECGGLWGELDGMGDDFFGGGADIDEITQNIRDFVANGNSLYVSDLAQPFIQESIPEAVDFYQESQGVNGPQQGTTQTVTADVISGQMQALLGANTTEISYDAGGWAVAEGGPPEATIHFQGDVDLNDGSLDDSALMISYDYPNNGGNAIFTSFHNSAQASGEMQEILEFMIFQL